MKFIKRLKIGLTGIILCGMFVCSAFGFESVVFDFTDQNTVKQWHPLNHISSFVTGKEGLEVTISGIDPYFVGPPKDYPTDKPLWMSMQLKSETGGTLQVFYFKNNATEEASVRANVKAGDWQIVEMPLPSLGAGYRLRIDPPGSSGKFILKKIVIDERMQFEFPEWNWINYQVTDKPVIKSGLLTAHTSSKYPFGVEFRYNQKKIGETVAVPKIGFVHNKKLEWIEFTTEKTTISAKANSLEIKSTAKDNYGGSWTYQQIFRAHSANTIAVDTEFQCSQERRILFAPIILISAGDKSWGTNKTQALFAGIEYLENEPSSSEADLIGPESKRQTPSPHKITFPLMSYVHNGVYVGLIWNNHLNYTAIFDTPDRIFNSRRHIMGVLYPGWEGTRRIEGEILPLAGSAVPAGTIVREQAYIIGGAGDTVIPSVQHYVKLRGLPELPDSEYDLKAYVELASYGWLKSKCRENNLYRHAYWHGFGLTPAADAAVYERWLATYAAEPLSSELIKASEDAISIIKPQNYYHSGVGHIRTPVVPLIFDQLRTAINSARETARNQLNRLGNVGYIEYIPSPGKPDYSKTHFARDANGLTAQVLASALEAAVFSGDRNLINRAIENLRKLDRYKNTVPRGAQTWEIPLHTPDILASAHLVNAYVLGYQVTGDKYFLEQARYWAWTGVPFVYLVNPTYNKVGIYSTIAVLGATSWKAPVWIGLPVQWCGLVYSDALYRLYEVDSSEIWKKIADGITVAGIQHTWKTNDVERGGLLPDSYVLKEQRSDGPAINPATLQINAIRLYTQIPIYQMRIARATAVTVHAPGKIDLKESNPKMCKFVVQSWAKGDYYVLVNGLQSEPRLFIKGKPTEIKPPHAFYQEDSALVLLLNGSTEIELRVK